MSQPLFSVITICRNAAVDLRTTANSVLAQECRDLEYIIVDGASTDSTHQVIVNLQSEFQAAGLTLRVISEPDSGIYDAMNKGTRLASGQWLWYMNAGDTFLQSSTLRSVADVLADSAEAASADVLYGSVELGRAYGNVISHPLPLDRFWRRMAFCHQACCVRRERALEHPYSMDYRIASDYEYFFSAYTTGQRFYQLPDVVAHFECENGLSTKNRLLVVREYGRINGRDRRLKWKISYIGKALEKGFNRVWRSLLPQSMVDDIRERNHRRRAAALQGKIVVREEAAKGPQPLVSVIIPAYNMEAYIEETLQSVLATEHPIEVIVSDDGSTDRTLALAREWAERDNRVVAITQQNSGVSRARNHAIEQAKGQYVLPVDADDLITPRYIPEAVKVLETHPEVKVVTCEGEFFGQRTGPWHLPQFDRHLLARKNLIPATALYRRADWEHIGGYCETMEAREDWDFWISMLKDGGEVVRLPLIGLRYRVRPGSKRFRDRKKDAEVTVALNRRHADFFRRELGGPLRRHRSWSRWINMCSRLLHGQ